MGYHFAFDKCFCGNYCHCCQNPIFEFYFGMFGLEGRLNLIMSTDISVGGNDKNSAFFGGDGYSNERVDSNTLSSYKM